MNFKAKKISDNIYWVGAIDWNIKDFHGYSTHRGTTYNAFLILADKITLIDTVKKPFFNEMMARISSIIDPKEIDYIVANHAELDHAGALAEAIEAISPDAVYTSTMGVKAIGAHIHSIKDKLTAVANGGCLNLGNMHLDFIETRMLHWPDSMFSILREEGVAFTNDAFGMHLSGTKRFADEYSKEILEDEGQRYFANILLPFSPLIIKLANQLAPIVPTLKMVLPDHGPLWRTTDDIQWIIGKYVEWATQKPTNKVVVLFDTMWGSTEALATCVTEGLIQEGLEPILYNCRNNNRSDFITILHMASGLIVGSPTINNNIFPALMDSLTYAKGLKPQNLIGATFGSYGWSGEAPKLLKEFLENMGVKCPLEPLRINYVPTIEDKNSAIEYGQNIGKEIASTLK